MGTEDFLKDILIKSLEESYRIAICENDFDFCFTVMDYLTEYMEKFDEVRFFFFIIIYSHSNGILC